MTERDFECSWCDDATRWHREPTLCWSHEYDRQSNRVACVECAERYDPEELTETTAGMTCGECLEADHE